MYREAALFSAFGKRDKIDTDSFFGARGGYDMLPGEQARTEEVREIEKSPMMPGNEAGGAKDKCFGTDGRNETAQYGTAQHEITQHEITQPKNRLFPKNIAFNCEDILLVVLIIMLLKNKSPANTELLIGIGFLLYIGIRNRNAGEEKAKSGELPKSSTAR